MQASFFGYIYLFRRTVQKFWACISDVINQDGGGETRSLNTETVTEGRSGVMTTLEGGAFVRIKSVDLNSRSNDLTLFERTRRTLRAQQMARVVCKTSETPLASVARDKRRASLRGKDRLVCVICIKHINMSK